MLWNMGWAYSVPIKMDDAMGCDLGPETEPQPIT